MDQEKGGGQNEFQIFLYTLYQDNLLGLNCNFSAGEGGGWAKCKVFC